MRLRLPHRWLPGALVAVALWAAGCGVSPQPEPPSFVPSIDIERITLGAPDAGGLALIGAAGAVKHGTSLTALDLDTTAPATTADVGDDGSFTVALTGLAIDAFRLQAFNSDHSSEPLDVTTATGLVPSDKLIPAPAPLVDCFLLDPPLEIGPLAAGASATVTMTNSCTSDVTLAQLTKRLGSAAWKVDSATGLVVPTGAERSFEVTFQPQAGGPLDDVLFVEITSPQAGRRPLTLRGP